MPACFSGLPAHLPISISGHAAKQKVSQQAKACMKDAVCGLLPRQSKSIDGEGSGSLQNAALPRVGRAMSEKSETERQKQPKTLNSETESEGRSMGQSVSGLRD